MDDHDERRKQEAFVNDLIAGNMQRLEPEPQEQDEERLKEI